jgi:hypothetical protein
VAAPVGRTGVAGDPLAPVEDLDGLVSDADIDQFTDQAVRGGIPPSAAARNRAGQVPWPPIRSNGRSKPPDRLLAAYNRP